MIIVESPGGGSKTPGNNVLIGNFALFGASGGMMYINGEAGDRFAVRNSGAMAVVEGVGDFACEYMTNGAVLNLGRFGKGFGNGMSGGNAYQYDPDDCLEQWSDRASIAIHRLDDDTDSARAHEQFVLYMLQQHAEYANSSTAKKLLANWEQTRKNFKYAEPLWLYRTQTAEHLAQSIDRKAMIEELTVAYAERQIRELSGAYQSAQPMFGGVVPPLGEVDSALSFRLINSFAMLDKAASIAREQLKLTGVDAPEVWQIEQATLELILKRPRKVQDAFLKNLREAYSEYDDKQLAWLLADKRLNDYKTALASRSVQSIHSLGSSAWIIQQHRLNQQALAEITPVEAYLAALSSSDIVQDMIAA